MAQLTYRDAVARGIAQEMRRDDRVVLVGEDVAGAGGVFKTTVGLLDEFGPKRVIDTPISEQAILGAAMGAAMTGLRPVAEIMFSDFFAVCWDLVVNEIAKTRYMTGGQVDPARWSSRPATAAALRFGAQHSQSIENWAMAVPGHQGRHPSTPEDVVGLMAAAIRDDDPVLFFEHKGLYATKGEVPDGEIVDTPRHGQGPARGPGRDDPGARHDGAAGARRGRGPRRPGHRRRGHRRAVPRAARHQDDPRVGRPRPVGCSPWRRTRRLLGGAPRSPPSSRDEGFWDLDGPVAADHHAAHPAAVGRLPRGPRHARRPRVSPAPSRRRCSRERAGRAGSVPSGRQAGRATVGGPPPPSHPLPTGAAPGDRPGREPRPARRHRPAGARHHGGRAAGRVNGRVALVGTGRRDPRSPDRGHRARGHPTGGHSRPARERGRVGGPRASVPPPAARAGSPSPRWRCTVPPVTHPGWS